MSTHRILCLQPTSLFERYGGAEYYFDDLLSNASALLGHGHVRTLVPRREKKIEIPERPYGVEAVHFKKKGVLGKIENRYSSDFFWTAFATINEFKPTHLLCAHVSLAPMTYALSRLMKIPYFTIALGIETWGNLWPQDEFALKRSHGILSISEWTKKILVDRGYDGKKISIVYPTINETFGALPPPQRAAKKPGELNLLTLSRLDANEQYKGQDHVLEALQILKRKKSALSLRYTIQGDGSDKSRLEKLVQEMQLQEIVEFKPAVKSRDALIRAYQDCDVFIMPSRFGKWNKKWHGEGFGIVYVEAAMLGAPSIAYACGGAMDIIQNGETGFLVPPDDKQALADSIAQFCDNPALAVEMGNTGYSIVRQKFGREEMRKSIAQALESSEAPR